jgi:RNA polymerase sigma-70 factor (ECF subfamily)
MTEPARDEDLVSRIRAGETVLFETLMRRYNQRLYRVARSILGREDEAEDVMQQAYVNAYTHLHQFAGQARFATWLTRIAVHEALARARRRNRREARTQMWDENGRQQPASIRADGLDPERQAHDMDLRRLLESAIDGLPAIYRSAFVLREAEGLDTPEVAEVLEISEDAVRTRLHRARALLRRDIFERTGATTAAAFAFHLSRCDRVVAGVLERLAASGAGPAAYPRLRGARVG